MSITKKDVESIIWMYQHGSRDVDLATVGLVLTHARQSSLAYQIHDMNQKYKTYITPRATGKTYKYNLNELIAEGLTIPQQRKRLKKFWEKHWRFNHTLDHWYKQITTHYSASGENDLIKVKASVRKLYLEERITSDKYKSLMKMLSTYDDADKLFALQIIATIKPSMFRKPRT